MKDTEHEGCALAQVAIAGCRMKHRAQYRAEWPAPKNQTTGAEARVEQIPTILRQGIRGAEVVVVVNGGVQVCHRLRLFLHQ